MADHDGATGSPQILIVDDDPIVRSALGQALSEGGYAVIQAGTAELGLQLMSEAKVDLVIADMGLPGMDGLRFLLHVRALYPNCATLMMTASRASDLRSLTYSGFDATQLVRKGISEVELCRVVARALGERAA